MSKNYAVVLRPDVRDLFPAGMSVLLHEADGFQYFLASKVEPNRAMYEMTIAHSLPNGHPAPVQLHIPHAYISNALAGTDIKAIGFY